LQTKEKQHLSGVTCPRGFRAAGGAFGIKASGRPDLMLLASDRPCAAAAVFTKNQVQGAPVLISRRHVRGGRARAVVCNAGCSNVATGQRGVEDAIAMCRAAGEALGVEPGRVLVASTGVIGRALPMGKITPGIASLAKQLSRGRDADAAAARAIMTTDTRPKAAVRRVTIDGRRITLGAIGKGAGMIAPNMATMLAFITTDAAVSAKVLRTLLRDAVAQTFNRMTIDSDTSTSDSVMVLANGAAENTLIDGPGEACDALGAALTELCRDLCEQLVRDGEGVTRLLRIRIEGAASAKDADRVGRAIADSPLVKCAAHGGDPNWGRLAMAVGKSGAKVAPGKLSIALAGKTVFADGQPTKLGLNPTQALEKAMRRDELPIRIALGVGAASADWLGCDLSREYVTINADYTT
jgi:glutamate N-acetyltransferase/amino-acid N-acetyltransferase